MSEKVLIQDAPKRVKRANETNPPKAKKRGGKKPWRVEYKDRPKRPGLRLTPQWESLRSYATERNARQGFDSLRADRYWSGHYYLRLMAPEGGVLESTSIVL